MPSNRSASSAEGDVASAMTRWERLKYSMVRPDGDDDRDPRQEHRSVEELEATIHRADDRERVIGLVAAPLAALIGLMISSASIDDAKIHHQSLAVYDELTYVILGLSVLMLAMAWWRKRLFLGITMALYGLAVFNLHYWGFGIPFLLAGAWYLVRAYRLQQALKQAESGTGTPARATGSAAAAGSSAARPRPNKRYTPPA